MAELIRDEKIERRLTHRLCIELQANYRLQPEGSYRQVCAKNLSTEGMALLLPEIVPTKAKLDLELHMPNGLTPFHVTGEVVWQSDNIMHTQSNYFLTGIHFTSVAPDHLNLLRGFLSTENAVRIQQGTERWRFPDKNFVYYKQVTLKHTNLEGNTYFDNYLTWHGDAREALLLSHPDIEGFFKNYQHIKMITHSVYQKFIRDSLFGDVIRIEVTSTKMRHCSFVFIYRFYNSRDNKLLGEGWQKICFSDFKTGRLVPIPQHILDLIEPIQERIGGNFFNQRC